MARLRLSIPKNLKVPILSSFVITLIILLAVLVFYFSLQPVVPLFYSLAEPSEYLAAKEWLFIFPAISLAITIIHFLLVNSTLHYEKVISELFIWITVLVQAVLALALFRILFIIT